MRQRNDPQPGCQLINIGVAAELDMNCNEVIDSSEGRCMPEGGAICTQPADCPACAEDADCASGVCINGGDVCPALAEFNHLGDLNNDGIGNECQCGDQTGDGNISALDIGGTAQCANGQLDATVCDPTIVDSNGDNATTAVDVSGIAQTANGVLQTSDLTCVRNP